jgi:hypothetical protein
MSNTLLLKNSNALPTEFAHMTACVAPWLLPAV